MYFSAFIIEHWIQNVADFFELFEKLCMEDYCGVMLKKLDKKKERLEET